MKLTFSKLILAAFAALGLSATAALATDPDCISGCDLVAPMVLLDLKGGTAGVGQVGAASVGDWTNAVTNVKKMSDLKLFGDIHGSTDGCGNPECGQNGGSYAAYASEQIWTDGLTGAASYGEPGGNGAQAASMIENSSAAALQLTGLVAVIPVNLGNTADATD